MIRYAKLRIFKLRLMKVYLVNLYLVALGTLILCGSEDLAYAQRCSEVFFFRNAGTEQLTSKSGIESKGQSPTPEWLQKAINRLDFTAKRAVLSLQEIDQLIEQKTSDLANLDKVSTVSAFFNMLLGQESIQDKKSKLQKEITELSDDQEKFKRRVNKDKISILEKIAPDVKSHFNENIKYLITDGTEFHYQILSVGPMNSNGSGHGRISLKAKELITNK